MSDHSTSQHDPARLNRRLGFAYRALGWALVGIAVAFAIAAWSVHRGGYRMRFHRVAAEAEEKIPLRWDAEPSRPFAGGPSEELRNVILIVGDGMGFNQVLAARAQSVGMNGRLFMEQLPTTGWLTTHSAQDSYTDSAAAATAMATGFKTLPQRLGLDVEGVARRNLFEAAADRGMRLGMVTSTVILDATPAAFTVHVEYRRDYEAVAEQMAALGPEILVSESFELEDEEDRARQDSIEATFARGGYALETTWEGLQRRTSGKTLGWLPPESIARSRAPALEEITRWVLDRLSDGDQGFFLLVEDEEIDSGGHNGSMPRVLAGLLDLDGVVRRAVDYARRDGQTLVLVTGDHETGGLTIPREGRGRFLPFHWTSTNHTAQPVPLFAFGPGAERFAGVHDNTEIAWHLAAMLGLELDSIATLSDAVSLPGMPVSDGPSEVAVGP